MSATPLRDTTCQLRDGRRLAFAEWGQPRGRPVLAFHGAPGSRLWCPDDFDPGKTTSECGVRLVTVDRPGYGRSDPLPGRTLLGWPDDVEQLLDALELERCPVVGVSAGAPFAMACAVRLPDRVRGLGLVSGNGPTFHVPGVWEQLDDSWRRALELGVHDPFAALDEARRKSQWLADEPTKVVVANGWTAADRWLVEDPAMRRAFLAFVREAGRQGIDGYAWDRVAVSLPWGFSPSDVDTETWLWCGERDPVVDSEEFERLCNQIPRSHCRVYSGEGHLLRGHWGQIFETVTAT